MSDENVLTKEIAEQFLADEDSVDLSECTAIDDDAAESLSKHKGSLDLNGLTSLSDAAAESLSKHKDVLCLNGLTSLSPTTATFLAKHAGPLETDLARITNDDVFDLLRSHPSLVAVPLSGEPFLRALEGKECHPEDLAEWRTPRAGSTIALLTRVTFTATRLTIASLWWQLRRAGVYGRFAAPTCWERMMKITTSYAACNST